MRKHNFAITINLNRNEIFCEMLKKAYGGSAMKSVSKMAVRSPSTDDGNGMNIPQICSKIV